MLTSQTIIKPAIGFTSSYENLSGFRETRYILDKRKIHKVLFKSFTMVLSVIIDKINIEENENLTSLEKELLVFLKEATSGKRALTQRFAKRFIDLHMAAVIERAKLIEESIIFEKDPLNEIYDEELMKVIFIIDTSKNTLRRIREMLITDKSKITQRHVDDYVSAMSHLFWIYNYILNEKRGISIDTLMQETVETKQTELKEVYNVSYY